VPGLATTALCRGCPVVVGKKAARYTLGWEGATVAQVGTHRSGVSGVSLAISHGYVLARYVVMQPLSATVLWPCHIAGSCTLGYSLLFVARAHAAQNVKELIRARPVDAAVTGLLRPCAVARVGFGEAVGEMTQDFQAHLGRP
jgi:hypothetical protein